MNLKSTCTMSIMFMVITSVDAGPLAYASCLAGCAAMGPFAPACWAACLPVLALPSP